MQKNQNFGNLTYKTTEQNPKHIEKILNPVVKEWFYSKYDEFSLPQKMAVLDIHSRKNILVSAPTGATKTLTSFMSILNELVDSSIKGILQDKVYAIYISPLKALNYDIHVNLIQPLKEMEEIYGKELGIRVGVRTGDTTTAERAAMTKKPPHILITTPESIALMINAPKFSEHINNVDWCIIDEIHALAENKRGVHLSLSMERLQRISPHMTRIGLSATIAPIEEIARFLVGTKRDCIIVDVQYIKDLDLKVISPVEDFINTPFHELHSEMYKTIHKMLQEHKSTLIFTNTRAATERVVHQLKDRFPKFYNDSNTGAHHGSLSKEHRHMIESNLREGKVKCVVCSTSLELGIDIGYIDLVILLGSPKSVARALQRCGRSGHKLHSKAKGRIIVMDRDDLVECSVLLKSAMEKKIDKIHLPMNSLDVLSQHIMGIALNEKISLKELKSLIRGSYLYHNISDTDIIEVLKFLSGKYVDLEERNVYARIWYDEDEGLIGRKGKMSRVIYMTNIGTIPDETSVVVKVGKEIVGTIEEGFLEKLKPGDVFVLGGSVYEFKYSRGMVAQVNASVNRPPTVPRWFSESLPLSFDLALEIGKFRRLMSEKLNSYLNYPKGKKIQKKEILDFIDDYLYLDKKAVKSIFNYCLEQFLFIGMPTDKRIIIEHYIDRDKHNYIFHTLFGRRVNDCLSRAVALAVSKISRKNVDLGMNDNGFYITLSKCVNIQKAVSFINSEKLEVVMEKAIDNSEIFKRRFRHCATRSFLILRNYLGRKKNVGRQQVSSMILMNALKRISNDFSILKETRREVFEDLMDIKSSKIVLDMINEGYIKIEEKETNVPSPFAFNLVMQGYSDIIRTEDRNEFIKRMHQLVLAKISMKSGSEEFDNHFSIDTKEFIKKIPKKKLSYKQEKLLHQLDYINLPRKVKANLISVIRSDKIEDYLLNELKQHKDEILKWPKDLSNYFLKKVYEFEKDNFSYQEEWDEEDKLKEIEDEEEKEKLFFDFKKASKRVGLDPQIQYDIVELIDDKNKSEIRNETKIWIQNLLKGSIPKIWSDDFIKFLRKRKNTLF